MTKDDLLKNIAQTGYNIGFGAKKHFSTYDMVNKIPGFINFFSLAFGVYALVFDQLSTKVISYYDTMKEAYEKVGVKLTRLYNDVGRLYYKVKTAPDEDLQECIRELMEIESQYFENSISKQIMFSDWYAHYKFFWQHQIEWVNEQKHFSLLRDKVPLSFSFTVIAVAIAVIFWFGCSIWPLLCSLIAKN
jgi:hypothetical protein